MTRPRHPSLCFLCERYVAGMDPDNDRDEPICQAFPEGIPSAIINGGFDHRKPLGNETILFRLAEGKTEEDIETWEQAVLTREKEDMLATFERFQGGTS